MIRNYIDFTSSSLTASFLISGNLNVSGTGIFTSFYGNIGIRVGGGTQTASNTINLFNNLLMDHTSNTTFNQTNSISQTSANNTLSNTNSQIRAVYLYTPAAIGTFSAALWVHSTGGGASSVFDLMVQQITV
jgi:hypothetical protein